MSARKIIERLGIELLELEEASCCGFFLDAVDHLSSSVFAARNLSLSEEKECNLLTLCPTCSGHMTRTRNELLEDPKLKKEVNAILGRANRRFTGSFEAKHITKVLIEDLGISQIKESIVKPLEHLRVAPHYGCHIMKPSDQLCFDNPENPKLLDSLIESSGVKLVNYREKKLCCGAPLMGVDEKTSLDILRAKIDSIQEKQIDAIVTICPFCHTHLDLNQARTREGNGNNDRPMIPVLHFTQVLGLAQGYEPGELGLDENRVPVDSILDLIG